MFAAALLVTWLVNLACCAGAAGYTPSPLQLSWHPAYWVAEGITLRRLDFRCIICTIVLLICGVIGATGWLGAILGLFALAPLPSLILDFSRRDSKLRGVDYIFHNPFSPVTERPTTITENGRQTEIYQKIYLYIPDDELQSMREFMDENEYVYLKGKRIAGCLFKATADPDFMLVFDSLRLNRYIVHPENLVAMDAFEAALKGKPAAVAPSSDEQDDDRECVPPHEPTDYPPQSDEEIPFGSQEGESSQIVDSAFASGMSQGKGGQKKTAMPKVKMPPYRLSADELSSLGPLTPPEQ